MICEKCGAIYTPPPLTHPNSYAASRCYDCYLEYVNVLLKCGEVKTTADDFIQSREVQDD